MNEQTVVPPPKDSWLKRAFRRVTAGGWLLLFFTVCLPALVLVVELWTRMCAELFLDPVPDVWHVAAVAVVPAGYLAAWLVARLALPRCIWPAAFLAGLAQGLSAYFALLMLPIALLGGIVLVMGWWYFGFGLLGLLPLAPALAFSGGFFLRRRLLRARGDLTGRRLRGMGFGWLAALLLMLALSAPGLITAFGLHLAISEDAARQARGLELLRRAGREDVLLQTCEWNRGLPGLRGLLIPDRRSLPGEQAHTLFYRVTGEDATLARRRSRSLRLRGQRVAEALEWDDDQGGNRVGGLLRGLSLYGSRYEARADAAAGLAYAEWTLVFRNTHGSEREARARIALPPGAVVSRLTLWIDGEEREAAFGGRSQVRQAYERVVQRRRDPVLVGTCGPDRIQVQCYPVPPSGGEMKVRIGFTAPLAVADDRASGRLDAPAIVERNFHMPHATLDLPQTLILPLDPPLAEACWARDSRATPPAIVRQTAVRGPAWRPARVAFVVDNSRAMHRSVAAVNTALAELPDGIEVRLWTAGDTPQPTPPIIFTTPADTDTRKRIARVLDPDACQGGRCNLRALQTAWDGLGNDPQPSALVWVHGPQPHPLFSADALSQRLERATRGIRFYALQVVPGTCRISEALDGVRGIRTLAPGEALADAGAPLRQLAGNWSAEATEWQIVRARAEEADVAGMREASDHLVRQWAVEEVRRRLISGNAVQRDEARQLALLWHLVTPVSSAVVLETQQQYQEAGLEPVKPSTVPTVPEPAFWISLLLSLGVLAVWRLHERRASRGT